MGLRHTQEDEKHATKVVLGFVSGHDFSRAVKGSLEGGFSPCQGSRQGLKARVIWPEVTRLKSCPDTKPEALGQPSKVHCRQKVFRPERSEVAGPAVSFACSDAEPSAT
jgi:hypothetical protein